MSSPRGRWRALAEGLHGHLDLPTADSVVTPGPVEVAGWVLHERWPVSSVVVMADGEVVGAAVPEAVREDVAAVHAARAPETAAGPTGWATTVTLPPRPQGDVTLTVHAVVDVPAEPTRSGEARTAGDRSVSGMVAFGRHTMRVAPHPWAHGRLTSLPPVAPGWIEVAGVARHPAGLARVEVRLGGGPVVRARHSLPGHAGFLPEPPEAGSDGFQVFVEVPEGAGSVTVTATAVGIDGTGIALPPLEVQVRTADVPSVPEERLRTLDARLVRRAEALARTADGPVRVLVATHDLSWGGAQLYLLLLVRTMRASGLDLCLVSGAGGEQLAELEMLGVPVLVVGSPAADREQLEAQRLQVASFAAAHRVVGCLANTLLAFPAVSAVQSLGIPVSWVVHESFHPHSFLRQYYGRALPPDVVGVLDEALGRCAEVVFVAEATRALHAPHLAPGAGRVVRYGVDQAPLLECVPAAEVAALRVRLGLRPGSRVLLCVGTVEPRKGQLALVRAFGRLPEELRAGAELVLLGAGDAGGDDYAAAVRSYADRAGLAGVRVVAADPDVTSWYRAADVLVSASDVESLPRTMLEAMSAGLPVAATDVFGVGELVVDGRTGFTCEPSDLGALTGLLEQVLTAPEEELRRLGAGARALVRERYDPAGHVTYFAERLAGWLAAASD